MTYCNVLPHSAILNESIAKGGSFYEQSKPGDSDNLRRGTLHRRDQLPPGGTPGNGGQPSHDLLPGDEGLHPGRLPAGDTAEAAPGDETAMMRHMAAGAAVFFWPAGRPTSVSRFRDWPPWSASSSGWILSRKIMCSSSAIKEKTPSRFSGMTGTDLSWRPKNFLTG